MKYSIPAEPKVGSKVVNKEGVVWCRTLESFHANWSREDNPGMFATWYQLVNIGVEDYTELIAGDAYCRYPDETFFGELKVYDGQTWHHFTYGFKDERIEIYKPGEHDDDDDTREWIKI